MRVVLFSRRPRPKMNYSIELIVAGLARELARLGVQVEHATSRFESNGVFRRAYNTIEAALRQGDVNHITGDVHFLAYLMSPEKTVLTIHDCGRISGRLDWRKRIIRELWFRGPARYCAAITVVSATVKEELLAHVDVPREKVHVVPSFVPDLYRRFDRPFNAASPTILHVGTAPNKNLLRLCEALRGMTCKLVVVGNLSGAQRARLEACGIAFENHVGVTTERMLQLYVDSDVVAFASTFEGFGMPIIEANFVGRPVVTSNVTSMPEVAGRAACLVDPFDVGSIRAGISRVIADATYREQIVAQGFDNARRFRPDIIAAQYLDIYEMVAAREPSLPQTGRAAASGNRVAANDAKGLRRS